MIRLSPQTFVCRAAGIVPRRDVRGKNGSGDG